MDKHNKIMSEIDEMFKETQAGWQDKWNNLSSESTEDFEEIFSVNESEKNITYIYQKYPCSYQNVYIINPFDINLLHPKEKLLLYQYILFESKPLIGKDIFTHRPISDEELQSPEEEAALKNVDRVNRPNIGQNPNMHIFMPKVTGWVNLLNNYCYLPISLTQRPLHLNALPQFSAPISSNDITTSLSVLVSHLRKSEFSKGVLLCAYLLFSHCQTLFKSYSRYPRNRRNKKMPPIFFVDTVKNEADFFNYFSPFVYAFDIVNNIPAEYSQSDFINTEVKRANHILDYGLGPKQIISTAKSKDDICLLITTMQTNKYFANSIKSIFSISNAYILHNYKNDENKSLQWNFILNKEASNIISFADYILSVEQAIKNLYVDYMSWLANRINGEIWGLEEKEVNDCIHEGSAIIRYKFNQTKREFHNISIKYSCKKRAKDMVIKDQLLYETHWDALDEHELLEIKNKFEVAGQNLRQLKKDLELMYKNRLFTRKITPTYFNRLQKEALKLLKKVRGTFNTEKLKYFSPLIAMLLSFKEFLNSDSATRNYIEAYDGVLHTAIHDVAELCLDEKSVPLLPVEKDALSIFKNYVYQLTNESPDMLSTENPHFWRFEKERCLYIDYDWFFQDFSLYCSQNHIQLEVSEHALLRETLYPRGIIVPRSKKKDGSHDRFDYLKVLQPGEPKQKVLKIRENILFLNLR